MDEFGSWNAEGGRRCAQVQGTRFKVQGGADAPARKL